MGKGEDQKVYAGRTVYLGSEETCGSGHVAGVAMVSGIFWESCSGGKAVTGHPVLVVNTLISPRI